LRQVSSTNRGYFRAKIEHKRGTKQAQKSTIFRYNTLMTVNKPSNDDSSVIGPEDADNLPQRIWPFHTTSAGQPDPSAAVASELFALRSEIVKSNQKKPQDLSLSYDEIGGILSIGQTEIKFKPTSNQGLVCSVLLRNKRNMSRSWAPKNLLQSVDPSDSGAYDKDIFFEAVRHINAKIPDNFPVLILRSEGRIRINKAYL